MEDFPTDHLPVLIRRTGWEWRGDFFDPDIPMGVELHFQFWNPRLERLPAPDTDRFDECVEQLVAQCRKHVAYEEKVFALLREALPGDERERMGRKVGTATAKAEREGKSA